MGLFDGLLARVENAVTSAEQRAAGLVTSAETAVGVPSSWLSKLSPAPPAATPFTTPFVGPLQPGRKRPADFVVLPKPQAVPVSNSTFNMVADAMANIPGIGAAERFLGLSSSEPAAPDYSADAQAWAHDLTRWANVLKSLDSSMSAKDGATDLSSQYRFWESGPYNAALTQVAALQNGHTPYAKAQAAYTDAVAQAKELQKAIQDRWAQFSTQDSPSALRYLTAPVTAPFEYAYAGGRAAIRGTEAAAARASAAIERVAAPAVASSEALLKYGPWILGGFALLYVSSFLPRARRD